MKKLFFLLPALAVSFALAFCSKTDVKEELNSVDSNLTASNRMTCNVVVTAASASELIFCGTQNNLTKCASCGPTPWAQGGFAISGTSPFDFDVPTPITFSVSSATGNTLRITTSANSVGPIHLGILGQPNCRTVTIDANCFVTVN